MVWYTHGGGQTGCGWLPPPLALLAAHGGTQAGIGQVAPGGHGGGGGGQGGHEVGAQGSGSQVEPVAHGAGAQARGDVGAAPCGEEPLLVRWLRERFARSRRW